MTTHPLRTVVPVIFLFWVYNDEKSQTSLIKTEFKFKKNWSLFWRMKHVAEFIDLWLGDKVNHRHRVVVVDFIPQSGIYEFGYSFVKRDMGVYKIDLYREICNRFSNHILRCIGKIESLEEFGLRVIRKNLSSLRIGKRHFRSKREQTNTFRKPNFKKRMFAFRVTQLLMMVQNHPARWCW
jgi:hypothetical protein